MGDGGKICYSKALATAGRVAHNASNGRVIYKRGIDNKHAIITITLEGVEEPMLTAQWEFPVSFQHNLTIGYNTPYADQFMLRNYADYYTPGNYSYWQDGHVEHIEYSHSSQSFTFRVWIDPLPASRPYFQIQLLDLNLDPPERTHHALVTVEQEGISTLSERVTVKTWGGSSSPNTLIYVDFDDNLKATGITWVTT